MDDDFVKQKIKEVMKQQEQADRKVNPHLEAAKLRSYADKDPLDELRRKVDQWLRPAMLQLT
jgi:hypothetical protein